MSCPLLGISRQSGELPNISRNPTSGIRSLIADSLALRLDPNRVRVEVELARVLRVVQNVAMIAAELLGTVGAESIGPYDPVPHM